MKQEELYIDILKGRTLWAREVPKKFLKDFQFCKVALDRWGIQGFCWPQQLQMNREAIQAWMASENNLNLDHAHDFVYDLLPEKVVGSISMSDSSINEVARLKQVVTHFDLIYSKINKIPFLKSVGGNLNLRGSDSIDLPSLERVGMGIVLEGSKVKELPLLVEADWILVKEEEYFYWVDYFNNSDRKKLADLVTYREH